MNTIIDRISSFLKEYQPFNHLSESELIEITSSIKVLPIEKNKALFKINDKLHDYFYVVSSGSINLSVISDAEETLLNRCNAGDVFGLRPFFAKNNYKMTAKAREDSIILAIPITTFKPLLAKNTEVLDYLLESFASTSVSSIDNNKSKINDSVFYNESQSEIQYFQTFEYSKNIVAVSVINTIKEVSQIMTDNIIDSVLVTRNNYPIGIVTDKDFRSKVGTGRYPILSPIDRIMSTPVITVPENLSLAEAQLLMLKHNVSHLCVTEDGSEFSEIKGIISEHDLVVAQANNPGVLIKEIKRSVTGDDLKSAVEKLNKLSQASISKNIPISNISMISGEITFAVIKRAIELTILEIGSPPTSFAWLSTGSQGRKEQILPTDQDSFLIFEDVSPDKYRDVKDYYIKLAKKTTLYLEKSGFKYCQNNHMASNLMWCKSISDWKRQYESWILNPGDKTTPLSSIFFDYEFVYGDTILENQITDTIYNFQKSYSLLFDFMGNEAIKHPAAFNFFKKLVVEENTPNKGKFDIKNRALLPYIDAARLLTISQKIRGINNTYLRFKQLAISEPKFAELYKNCAESFLLLSKLSVLEGFNNDNSGQFLTVDEISKTEIEKIKNALLPIKDLEDLIKDKFQLTHFS